MSAISLSLNYIFNQILQAGIIPKIWRQAINKPIPKSSMTDPRIPQQYCGISLLSNKSKLFTSIRNKIN